MNEDVKAGRIDAGAGTPLKQADGAGVLFTAEDQLGFFLALRHLLPRRHGRRREHRHDGQRDEQGGHRIPGFVALQLTP